MRAAGPFNLHWTFHECFQGPKDELGLDHCEMRSWDAWQRYMSASSRRPPSWLVRPPTCAGPFGPLPIPRAASSKANERSPTAAAAWAASTFCERAEIRALLAQFVVGPPTLEAVILGWSRRLPRHHRWAAMATNTTIWATVVSGRSWIKRYVADGGDFHSRILTAKS